MTSALTLFRFDKDLAVIAISNRQLMAASVVLLFNLIVVLDKLGYRRRFPQWGTEFWGQIEFMAPKLTPNS